MGVFIALLSFLLSPTAGYAQYATKAVLQPSHWRPSKLISAFLDFFPLSSIFIPIFLLYILPLETFFEDFL
jgi:hypothetical protein